MNGMAPWSLCCSAQLTASAEKRPLVARIRPRTTGGSQSFTTATVFATSAGPTDRLSQCLAWTMTRHCGHRRCCLVARDLASGFRLGAAGFDRLHEKSALELGG